MRYSKSKIMAAVCAVILAIALLVKSSAVSEGIRAGLAVCGNTLIPSLFPFLVLSGFLSLTEYGAVLARPLRALWRGVYRVPDEAGAVILLSLVGGYPVGAKGIAALLGRGIIDRPTAGRMLCFCVSSGPSFLITAVGAGLLRNRTAGVILFTAQTAATLLTGAAASLRAPFPLGGTPGESAEPGGGAFPSAVSGACGAMMTICAVAVLFSGMLSLVNATALPAWLGRIADLPPELISTLLAGFFEVTSGCAAASVLGGAAVPLTLSAFVSFGGLSVIFQIISCLRENPVSLRPFLFSRLVHAPLAAAIALPLWRYFCGAAPVFESVSRPVANMEGPVWASSACLIGMCTILIFLTKERSPLHKSSAWDKIMTRYSKRRRNKRKAG